MSGKTFVDTNVLVYAYDQSEPGKQAVAIALLEQLWSAKTGVVSPQVLQEFYVTVTRKIRMPLARGVARTIVASYASWCLPLGAESVLAAFGIEDEAKISFWDALIVASALKAGAKRVVSEDLNSGQRIGGVEIHNPFG